MTECARCSSPDIGLITQVDLNIHMGGRPSFFPSGPICHTCHTSTTPRLLFPTTSAQHPHFTVLRLLADLDLHPLTRPSLCAVPTLLPKLPSSPLPSPCPAQHPHFTVLRLLADLDLFASGGGAGAGAVTGGAAGGVGGCMGDYRDLVQGAWNLINDRWGVHALWIVQGEGGVSVC